MNLGASTISAASPITSSSILPRISRIAFDLFTVTPPGNITGMFQRTPWTINSVRDAYIVQCLQGQTRHRKNAVAIYTLKDVNLVHITRADRRKCSGFCTLDPVRIVHWIIYAYRVFYEAVITHERYQCKKLHCWNNDFQKCHPSKMF